MILIQIALFETICPPPPSASSLHSVLISHHDWKTKQCHNTNRFEPVLNPNHIFACFRFREKMQLMWVYVPKRKAVKVWTSPPWRRTRWRLRNWTRLWWASQAGGWTPGSKWVSTWNPYFCHAWISPIGKSKSVSQNTFPLIFLPPPYPIPSLLIYALPVWGVVVRSGGRNSILTNLTQFVERLARGRVQPVKHWPLASGWDMGDGFGWGG